MKWRFFAIGLVCLFVCLGFQSVALRLGVAVVVDEAHAWSERVLRDRGSRCRVIVEAPGESENANEENYGA